MKSIDEIRRANLLLLRDEFGSLKKLALVVERDDSQVSQWLQGSKNSGTGKARGMRSDTARHIESKTGKQEGWLDQDHSRQVAIDARFSVAEPRQDFASFENVETAPARGRVPLISWVQAGSFSDVQDFYQPGEADEWVSAYHTSPSQHAFALRVDGDSMTSPVGRSFPDGCVIIVDPLRGPKHGDYVIAKNTVTQKATFKQLTSDGLLSYLKPLNPAYPTLEIDDNKIVIVGVVIEWYMGGRI